ncbi:MAG TPA: hypothetical protein VN157_11910 [Caulobacter sp.]|nr:hypothetical protein [Caulobacter sp.]
MINWVRAVDWIAGDGRLRGSVLRLGVVSGGGVVLAVLDGARHGRSVVESLTFGFVSVAALIAAFGVWRWNDWRRRVRRRGSPPVRTLNLD